MNILVGEGVKTLQEMRKMCDVRSVICVKSGAGNGGVWSGNSEYEEREEM